MPGHVKGFQGMQNLSKKKNAKNLRLIELT